MAEKETIMKLKVDLECEKCSKKVKKLLAKYPQIRDEKFDEKQNIVTITVVCCSPEKIRDKLCRKGGGSIKSIEIVEPPKPKPSEPVGDKPKPKPADAEKPKPKPADAEKPKPKPAEAEKPKPRPADAEKPQPKPADKPPEPKPAPPPVPAPPYPPVPPPMAVPVGICCVPCSEGRPGGPCVNGYVGAPLCYDGYYGRPVYDSYGGGRPYYVSRCDQYLSDENATGCTIM